MDTDLQTEMQSRGCVQRPVRLAAIRASNRSPWPTGWRVGVRSCPCCEWPLSYNDWEWGREWSCPQCGFEESEPNSHAKVRHARYQLMKNTLIAIEEAENGFTVEINPYSNDRKRAVFENTSAGHQKLLEWLMAAVTSECLNP